MLEHHMADAVPPGSVLFIVLDSCRYDSFLLANAPNLKMLGPIHRAEAPSYFTYGSHAAMFVGFTPGLARVRAPLLNPKFAKIFKLVGGNHAAKGQEAFVLSGRSIVEGFRHLGYLAIGSGAVGWFDPETPTGRNLTADFEHFHYPGSAFRLTQQLAWLEAQLDVDHRPVFAFLNIGETHVPYYFDGAPWSSDDNPCLPFQTVDRSNECRMRQIACVEFVDKKLAPFLRRFQNATIVVSADHGDCWGEDGLWEHGISHEMTLTVPLIIRIGPKLTTPVPTAFRAVTPTAGDYDAVVSPPTTSEPSPTLEHRRHARCGAPIAILVLGMHRSGTSALTRTLSLLGADLPQNLVPSAEDNPAGFWESKDWVALHDDILATHALASDSPLPLPPGALTPEALTPFRRRLMEILKLNFAKSALFVAKDPRMCRLVPLWQQALAELDFGARYVLIIRHPMEIAASLAEREGMPEEAALLLWMRCVLEAERASRGKPRIFVSYQALLEDWYGVVDRIAAAIGINWPTPPATARAEIESFLKPELRHHHAANDSSLDRYTWPKAVYEAALASFDDERVAHAAFDAVGHQLMIADEFIAPLLAGCRDSKIAQLSAEVGRLVSLNGLRETELADQRQAVAEREEQLARVRAELDARNKELAQVDQDLASLRIQLAEIASSGAAATAKLKRIKRSFSWRLTSPLRELRRVVTRPFRVSR